MRECPTCGAITEDEQTLCPNCGSEMQEKTPVNPEPSEKADVSETTGEKQSAIRTVSSADVQDVAAVKNGQKTTKLIVAATAALIAVLLVIVAAYSSSQRRGEQGGDPDVPSAIQTDVNGELLAPIASGVNDPSGADISNIAGSDPYLTDVTASQNGSVPQTSGSGLQTAPNTPNYSPSAAPQNPPAQNGQTPSPVPAPSATAAPTVDPFVEFVNALNSGNYLMNGTMRADGDTIPMSMAFFGENVRMSTDIDGFTMEMAIVDKKIYLINPSNKTYMTVTEDLAEKLELSESDFDVSSMKWSLEAPSTAVKSIVQSDGVTMDCYTIGTKNSDATMKVYVSGNTIKRFDLYESNGTMSARYDINSFKAHTSMADVLPDISYKSKNFITFFAALIPELT